MTEDIRRSASEKVTLRPTKNKNPSKNNNDENDD